MNYFLWAEESKARNQLTEKYEPLQPFLFLSFLEFSGAEVVLDVGANIGLYSLVSTMAVKVQSVYAFEPDETAYSVLIKNICLNGLEEIVKPLQSAVSSREGLVRFGLHEPMSGVNCIVNTSIHDSALFSASHDVPAMTLGQLEGLSGKVLGVKIDVEGHELQVIEGAIELLEVSPAIVQVEHYIGCGIDDKLNKIGYFCFFVAGQDHYFTNIRNFSNPLFVKRAAEYAVSWMIETHAERWPYVNTIKSCLSLKYNITDGEIYAQAFLNGGFFSEPEYAFYLMVDGDKVEEQWYQPDPKMVFKLPLQAQSIEIKAFVREKKLPNKKIVVGEFIKRPVIGYRAESAVGESLGLPSQYAAVANLLGNSGENFSYSELNLSSLLQAITNESPREIIQIGGGDMISALFEKGGKGHLSIICTPDQVSSFNNGSALFDTMPLGTSKSVAIYTISKPNDFNTVLVSLFRKLRSKTYVLLRGQFLTDIGVNVADLSLMFTHFSEGSMLYAEGLANDSYKNELAELADKYGVTVEWLYPNSVIIQADELKPARNSDTASNWLQDDRNYTEHASSYSIVLTNHKHNERSLGLDFSLPED